MNINRLLSVSLKKIPENKAEAAKSMATNFSVSLAKLSNENYNAIQIKNHKDV